MRCGSRDRRDRATGGGDRAPRLLHAAHDGCDRNGKPHRLRLSAAPTAGRCGSACEHSEGSGCAAPSAPRRRRRFRIPAVEVMITTGFIGTASWTRTAQGQIHALSRRHLQYGMQTFDQSIFALYQQGFVTLEEALRGRPTGRVQAEGSGDPPHRTWLDQMAPPPRSGNETSRGSGLVRGFRPGLGARARG